VREATVWLRLIGSAFVLIGDALAIIGLFSPWYRLYTSFGDAPGEHVYGPWTVLRESAAAPLTVVFWVFLPVAVLVASSVASLLIRASRGVRANLGNVALLLAYGCFAVVVGVLVLVPQGLPLSWPYFTTRGVEYGAWAGVAGFVCVALGILCIRASTGANADRPATLPG
jgi:hypothetical protein